MTMKNRRALVNYNEDLNTYLNTLCSNMRIEKEHGAVCIREARGKFSCLGQVAQILSRNQPLLITHGAQQDH